MRVALVYDRVNKWGGAERVLLALHRIFPDAPLYTSVYDKKKAPWANVFNVKTSFLQRLPLATNHELFAVLMPLAFETFSFDEYDLVVSVTSEAAKGIITKPKTKHICYCLTPTRYLWSGYDEYFKNSVLRFLSKPAVWYLRFWDKIAANRPDKFIAISKEVQSRISKYYGRESEVVYPPLEFGKFARQPRVSDDARLQNPQNQSLNSASLSKIRLQSGNLPNFSSSENGLPRYFLIVSRLVPYKKIDLAIKVFNKLDFLLKIVGVGSEMRRLKNMAKNNIEFLGSLTDRELVRYYSECRALIFPGIEDFGLTILEAQSFGKPVIAFRSGGALETIIDGKTGLFFDKQTIESLEKAVRQFKHMKFGAKDCIENTQRFRFEKFRNEILKQVQNDTEERKNL
ncbi:MAG: glycosyltransferase [Candidatus Levybacteria bacterium]|nr:glycosyltransferase [Candidatus Levybacteria bacterium]